MNFKTINNLKQITIKNKKFNKIININRLLKEYLLILLILSCNMINLKMKINKLPKNNKY